MRDFNHTVNVLVKAYLNDTLTHGDDCGCAVGNLIAHSIDVDPMQWDPSWHVYLRCGHRQEFKEEAIKEVAATGYSILEILRIEEAFEWVEFHPNNDLWVFNGLMAVVDVLAEIHGIDLKEREEAKALFVNA